MASPMGLPTLQDALVSPPLLRAQTWPQTEQSEEQWLLQKQKEWSLEDEEEEEREDQRGQPCKRKWQEQRTQETRKQGRGEQQRQQEHTQTADEEQSQQPETHPQKSDEKQAKQAQQEQEQQQQHRPEEQETQQQQQQQSRQQLLLVRTQQEPHTTQQETPGLFMEKATPVQHLTRQRAASSAPESAESSSAGTAPPTRAAASDLHARASASEATSLHAASVCASPATNFLSQTKGCLPVAAAAAAGEAREADAAAGPSTASRGASKQGTEERAAEIGSNPSAAATEGAAMAYGPPADRRAAAGHTRSEQAAWRCSRCGPSTTVAGGSRGSLGSSSDSSCRDTGVCSNCSGRGSSGGREGSGSSSGDSGTTRGVPENTGAGDRRGGDNGSSLESSSDRSHTLTEGRRADGKRSSSREVRENNRGRSLDDYVVHSIDENTITFTYKGFLFSSVTRRKRRAQREGAGTSGPGDATAAAASGETGRSSSSSSAGGWQKVSAAVGHAPEQAYNMGNYSFAVYDTTLPPGPAGKSTTAAVAAATGGDPPQEHLPPTLREGSARTSSGPPLVAAAVPAEAAAPVTAVEAAASHAAAADSSAGQAAAAASPGVEGGTRLARPPAPWYVPARGRHYCCYVSHKGEAVATAIASAKHRYEAVKQEQQQQQRQQQQQQQQQPQQRNRTDVSREDIVVTPGDGEDVCSRCLTAAPPPHLVASCVASLAAVSPRVAAAEAAAATLPAPAIYAAAYGGAAAVPAEGGPRLLHSAADFAGETVAGAAAAEAATTVAAAAAAAASSRSPPQTGVLLQEGATTTASRDRSLGTEETSGQGESRLSHAAGSPEASTAAAAAAVVAPVLLDMPVVQAERPAVAFPLGPEGSRSSSWTSSSSCSSKIRMPAVGSSSGTPGGTGGTPTDSSSGKGEERRSSSSEESEERGLMVTRQPCLRCVHSSSSTCATGEEENRPGRGRAAAAAGADVAAPRLLPVATQTGDSTAGFASRAQAAAVEAVPSAAPAAEGRGGERGGRSRPTDEEKVAAADKQERGTVTELLQQMTQHSSSLRVAPARAAPAAAAAAPAAVPAPVAGSASAEEAAAADDKNRWTIPAVEAFMLQLRRGELRGSHQAARRTAEVLRQVVDQHPWKTTQELVDVVKQLGRSFRRADPMEFLVSNVVRRILCIIRTEHCKQLRKRQPQEEEEEDEDGCSSEQRQLLQGLGSSGSTGAHGDMTRLSLPHLDHFRTSPLRSAGMHASPFPTFPPRSADDPQQLLLPVPATVKHSIFEGISELLAEVDTAWEEGEDVRTACFSNGDCILTYGYSLAVERLLKALHRKNQGEGATHNSRKKKKKGRVRCSFQVLVLGGDTEQGGKKMAERLVAAGIKTAYVADAALLTVIHKVDKVLLGTRAILSSGGAVALSGARYVAEAAKIYNRPVMVVAPLFKLTHLPLYDQHSRNQLLSPSAQADTTEPLAPRPRHCWISLLLLQVLPDLPELKNVSIRIPKYDYIPDSLLAVFITEIGPVDPSCLFFLAQQRYDVEDLDLCAVV